MPVVVATAPSSYLRLLVDPKQPGRQLKLDIAPSTAVPVAEMRVTFNARPVDDAATLAAAGIEEGAVLQLERGPPHAGPAPATGVGGVAELRRTMWVVAEMPTGKRIHLYLDPRQSVQQLALDLIPRVGSVGDGLRFYCDGRRMQEGQSVQACGAVDGCVIDVIPQMRGDIGVFVSPSCPSPLPGPDGGVESAVAAPGAAWLAAASPPSPPAAEVAAMVAQVLERGRLAWRDRSGSAGGGAGDAVAVGGWAAAGACCATAGGEGAAPWRQSSERVVGDVAAAHLVALVDSAWLDGTQRSDFAKSELAQRVAAGSTEGDFKLLLAPATLRDAVGPAAYAQMLAALFSHAGGGEPDAVVLRRTAPAGRWIGFHTDDAARTVQVPLTGDAECEGGRLVFALPSGALVAAPRRVGAMLAHDGDVVHGVTRLTRGVRYGLYLLRERAAVRALPSPALVA